MVCPSSQARNDIQYQDKRFKSFAKRILSPFIGIALFIIAVWVLYIELQKYHFKDIVSSLYLIPIRSLFLSLLLTIVSYGVKIGYDYYSLRIINKPLAYRRIAVASIVGFVISNNVGLSVIPGASVRYRLYSPLGLNGLDIMKIVFSYTISLWVGFLLLSSTTFILKPILLPPQLHLPFKTDYLFGLILLITLLFFIGIAFFWNRTLKVFGLEFSRPPMRFFLPQICIATSDWIIAASVLFVLLPSGVSYSTFLSIFLIAQLAGIISQMPAGLGVFDAAVVIFLTHSFPAYSVFASLIVYRTIYYIIPLIPAIAMLAIEETID